MANKELSLRQQLDALAAEGKEIKVTWEGGNDAGGYDLYIDGVRMDYYEDQYDAIVNPISNRIDYGSWAGDFSADGEVIYDPALGEFVGSGKETETEPFELDDISIEIRVPKALNFDRIEIATEGTYCWGELLVRCGFVITNGPVFPDHTEIEDAMSIHVHDLIDTILSTHKDAKNEEIGWVYNEWSIPRESLREDGDDLVTTLTNLDFSFNKTVEKFFNIPINED